MVALVLGLVVIGGVALALVRGGDTDEPAAAGSRAVPAEGPREITVSFTGADGLALRGALRVPEGADGLVPGVVIIPGFGPTTRDGVAPPGGTPDPLYRDLSRALAEAGVASLRYDKRGTGESVMEADQPRSFDDMVEDAAAAFTFLGERVEVDPESVGVVGHDEGGLTALRLAATELPVGALVLVATPGRPLVDVLADDFVASSEEPGHGEEHAEELRAVVGELIATGELPNPGSMRSALRPIFPAGEEEYLRAIFSLDPAEEAADVAAPTLVVRGGADPGVSAEDAELLVGALRGDTDVLVGAQAGHTLAIADADADADADGDDDDDDDGDGDATGGDAAHDPNVHGGAAVASARDDDLLSEVGAWVADTLGVE
ncbi:MAG: alpha/beta fold hydrolase [Egibacteraceae bacterium]